jgi:DNA (cytosine-5)-methyltransferase 1
MSAIDHPRRSWHAASCVSLFAGCGGLDLGLRRAGFDIVVATDAEPLCAQTHQRNFPRTTFLTRRIKDVTSQEILRLADLRSPGALDLLAGGPPCPAFSKSRFYRKDKPRALEDPVAAETVGGYLRLLAEVRPKIFLLENVKGLAYGVHKQALDHILGTARALGYAVDWRVLNAADYGVPQIRERCFVMGSRLGDVSWPVPTHSKDPLPLVPMPLWLTAGEVLADLDTEENAVDDGHFAGGQFNSLLHSIPAGDNYLYFTKERGHPSPIFKWRSRYWSFLLKLSPNLPSWTIQARRSNNMGPFHWRNRILRVAEVKRLQTFPDDFELSGNVEQQWRQIGNAVPPLLAEALGNAIRGQLQRSVIGEMAA